MIKLNVINDVISYVHLIPFDLLQNSDINNKHPILGLQYRLISMVSISTGDFDLNILCKDHRFENWRKRKHDMQYLLSTDQSITAELYLSSEKEHLQRALKKSEINIRRHTKKRMSLKFTESEKFRSGNTAYK